MISAHKVVDFQMKLNYFEDFFLCGHIGAYSVINESISNIPQLRKKAYGSRS